MLGSDSSTIWMKLGGQVKRYRKQVSALVEAFNEDAHRQEVTEIIRGLIERITLTPADDGGLSINLECDLASNLRLATDSKKPRGFVASGPLFIGCEGTQPTS